MKKLAMTLAVAAFALGATALQANAQYQRPGAAACFYALKNATPVIKRVDCRGGTGGCGCGPGWISACAPGCCRCVPC